MPMICSAVCTVTRLTVYADAGLSVAAIIYDGLLHNCDGTASSVMPGPESVLGPLSAGQTEGSPP